jgi:CelD/BcsL family acetyltransferase involved in cellulose biosynthesis
MGQATQVIFESHVELDDGLTSDARIVRSRGSDISITISIYRDLVEIESDWRAFEKRADCTAFQSFEWLSVWQRQIGSRSGVMPAVVAGRDSAGALLFLLPLAIEPRGWLRQLRWLGSDLCDYNAPLLCPGFAELVDAARFVSLWRDVVARLGIDPDLRCDLISLEKMPEAVGAQPNPFLQLGARLHPNGAYAAQLGDNWETFYNAKRSSDTRRRDRNKRKKLAGFGEVRFVNPDTAEIGPTLDMLFEQKAQAFAHMGVANIFAKPGYREFFREVATDPRTRHLVHVSRLDTGDTFAAINLGLIFRDHYYHVLASYDGGEVSKFGPGAAHLHDLLRHAIERKCSVFDFTIGDERYKRDWSDIQLKLFDHAAAVTPRGWPVVVGSRALGALKRCIKQTPAIWKAYSAARAFIGSLRKR